MKNALHISPPRRLRRLARLPFLAALLLTLAFGLLQLAIRLLPLPPGRPLPQPAIFLTDRDNLPLAAFVSDDDSWHIPLRYDEISPHLLNAIIAVEDRRFFQHSGVDLRAVASAAVSDFTSLRIVRGASTLTMQVARLRDPQPRSVVAKAEQAFVALQLEQHLSKQQILAEYLNRAPFGGNLVGAGAASWRYFGKSCRDLSLGQAALLAGLPQSPNRFRPDRFPARASIRRDYVLDRMVAAGFISTAQADEARREPMDARWRPTPQAAEGPQNPAVPVLSGLASNPPEHSRQTTLSSRISHQATVMAREQLLLLKPASVTAAAVVVLDTQTAECLAALSFSADAPNIDLTAAHRSSGSTLKPFIYAAAFDTGQLHADSLLDDSPASWAGYTPLNFDRTFRGQLPASDALAESRNIPAMTVLATVGIPHALSVMDALGLHALARSHRDYGLALAIGGAEVSPLELASAYSALAREGRPLPVKMWRTSPSEILNLKSPIPPPHFPIPNSQFPSSSPSEISNLKSQIPNLPSVLSAASCAETLSCLSNPDRTRQVAPEATALRPAWKTGTSSGRRDAWCAAVTPHFTVVVWMGDARGKGSEALVGQDAAAPLALRLLASLDSTPTPWQALPAHEGSPIHLAPLTAPLAIVTPTPNQQIFLDPDQPAARQRIHLTSSGGTEGPRFWFVDGDRLFPDPSGALWYSPTPGRHELRVTDPDAHSAKLTITVR